MVSNPSDNVHDVSAALSARYEDFAHNNLSDPLDELLFIICSQKTSEVGYVRLYSDLHAGFPTYTSMLDADRRNLVEVLKSGGLAERKSKAIQGVLRKIKDDFGDLSLNKLADMDDAIVESYLLSLPGVGKKIARCVMMYSLGRNVFPVDTHCWRISRRIGWVRRTRFDGRCSPRDMDRLQDKIPPSLRFPLHVNMVSLGRDLCRPINPSCQGCPINRYCRKIGVPKRHNS